MPRCLGIEMPWNNFLTASQLSLHSQGFDDFLRAMVLNNGQVMAWKPSWRWAVQLCLSIGLKFCYIVQHSILTEDDLEKLQDVLVHFHCYQSVFVTDGVCKKGISLPRQHALVHYHALIQLFGAPKGLCTSLSESKHKDSTKVMYHHSNQNNPLGGQMLVENMWIYQLCATSGKYMKLGMLGDSELDSGSPLDKSISTNFCHTNLTFWCHSVAVPFSTGSTIPEEHNGSGTTSEPHNCSETDQSIPDENPLEEVVSDLMVLAEVKLAARPSESVSCNVPK